MEAYNEFGLLLASVFAADGKAAIVTTEAAGNERGAILLGADPQGGLHVLAPMPEDYAVPLLQGEAIQLRDWNDNLLGGRHLDLSCARASLAQVFAALADDVIARVRSSNDEPFRVMLAALDDWRRLFRPAREMSVDRARGLFGEMLVLKRLAQLNPSIAPDLWTGPGKSDHDFTSARGDLEVKTSGSEGLSVVISSLDQLDPQGSEALVLVRQRLLETPQGRSLGDMVEELVSLGVLRNVLVEKLQAAGFLLGVDADEHRFVEDGELVAWLVDEDFPGLRTSDIPDVRRPSGTITRVSYTLDLAAAAEPMSSEHLEAHLRSMVGL